jgi:hypothetical protein
MARILTDAQLREYGELGFLSGIPVLTAAEVAHYRAEADVTCRAVGPQVTRLDGPHLFFPWAWELATHPRLLDALERLLGPNILLKSTRLFYKHGGSSSYVGWHQDGITEEIADADVPAVWLGLTDATADNGCLRVVPRSHRIGLVPHADLPDANNLTSMGATAQAAVENPVDVVMNAGEMSLHHPLVLHGSDANRSPQPRIGFSATYASRAMLDSRTTVAWVRGGGPRHPSEVAGPPPSGFLDEAVAAYKNSGHQILYATEAS